MTAVGHRLTCIHRDYIPIDDSRGGVTLVPEPGLCAECQQQYETDPESYHLYGDHEDGLRRWSEMKEQMLQEIDNREPPEPNYDYSSIPF